MYPSTYVSTYISRLQRIVSFVDLVDPKVLNERPYISLFGNKILKRNLRNSFQGWIEHCVNQLISVRMRKKPIKFLKSYISE